MARRSKSELIDRYYSGNPVEIVNGDIAAFTCLPGKELSYLWDLRVRGLAIRATPSGRKTYIVRRDLVTPSGRKQYKTAIGACDELTLEDARQKAEALIRRCAELGLTQAQMAHLIGASPLSVYKWETGKVTPRAAQQAQIAAALKLGRRAVKARLEAQGE